MQYKLITLVSSLALVFCQMGTDNRDERDSKQKGKRMTLSFALQPEGKAATFSVQKYALVIKNSGVDEVLLDRRLLNPVVFVEITDEQGKLVPRIPPSVPTPFSDKEVFVMKPGKEARFTFAVSDVTMEELSGKRYGVVCHYDSSKITYPASKKMWRGTGKTERVFYLAK